MRVFIHSMGAILALTGMAKVWSACGNAHALTFTDPIIGWRFDHLMLLVGVVELGVAGVCLFSKSQTLSTILVAWLASSFLAYRLGLWLLGWNRPCPCMGTLTDAIHVSPQLADNVMKVVLVYLLVGSYATLFWLWRQNRKVE